VSAILKALKKLEQETAENTGTPLTSAIKGRPQKQTGKRSGSRVIPGLIAFILCIFTGIGITIFTLNTSVPESPIVHESNEKPVPSGKISEKKILSQNRAAAVDNRKPAVEAPEFEFSSTGLSIADKQQPDASIGGRELPDAQPSKMPPKIPTVLQGSDHTNASVKTAEPFPAITPLPEMVYENRLPVKENQEPTAVFQTDVSAVEPPVPTLPAATENAIAAKPVEKRTEPPVAVIEDPAVELQAISWSANAAKRLAVINGKICREKDRVAGYMIQAINPGDVVVSKGSSTGKFVFEIR
jgi:hypothetical protein